MGMTSAARRRDASGQDASAAASRQPTVAISPPPNVQRALARAAAPPAAPPFRVTQATAPKLARLTEAEERKKREEKKKNMKGHPLGLPMPLMLVKNDIVPGEGVPAPLVKHSAGRDQAKQEEIGKTHIDLPAAGIGLLNLKGSFEAGYKLDGALTCKLQREVNEEDMDKPADPVIDKLGLNGTVKAKGSVGGSISAFMGFDAKVVGIEAGLKGSVKVSGDGEFKVNGGLTSKGDPEGSWKPWGGELDYSVNITADVTVAASGYFKWKLLFLGDEYEVKLGEWKAGTITVTGSGKMGYANPPKLSDLKIKFNWGSVPKPETKKEKSKGLLGLGVLGLKRATQELEPPPPDDKGGKPTLRNQFPLLARTGGAEEQGGGIKQPPPMPIVEEE